MISNELVHALSLISPTIGGEEQTQFVVVRNNRIIGCDARLYASILVSEDLGCWEVSAKALYKAVKIFEKDRDVQIKINPKTIVITCGNNVCRLQRSGIDSFSVDKVAISENLQPISPYLVDALPWCSMVLKKDNDTLCNVQLKDNRLSASDTARISICKVPDAGETLLTSRLVELLGKLNVDDLKKGSWGIEGNGLFFVTEKATVGCGVVFKDYPDLSKYAAMAVGDCVVSFPDETSDVVKRHIQYQESSMAHKSIEVKLDERGILLRSGDRRGTLETLVECDDIEGTASFWINPSHLVQALSLHNQAVVNEDAKCLIFADEGFHHQIVIGDRR